VAGQTLLVEARATLQQAEQALQRTREAAAGQSGSLRVGYVGSALYGRLPGLIRCFRQQYPQVQLHLQEATSRQQQLWLRAAHRRRCADSTDSRRRAGAARLRP
jgi:DNA-binding transcriptional LysR family regulator